MLTKLTVDVITFRVAVIIFTVDISKSHRYTQDNTCNFLTSTVKVMTAPVKVMTATVSFNQHLQLILLQSH